tara:strand:- start:7 stop:390 length:384 start_codon:yes stop_codon:yes gene_type:complete
MTMNNKHLILTRRFESGEFTHGFNPGQDEVAVYYDQKIYVYKNPPKQHRYDFCVELAVSFETHLDFVPVWRDDRTYHPTDWALDCYDEEHNEDLIVDPSENANANYVIRRRKEEEAEESSWLEAQAK